MIFDVFDPLDPNGAALGTLTDAFDKEIYLDLNGPGSGRFRINRHDPTASLVRTGRIVKVKRDGSAPYRFAFVIEEGKDVEIDDEEEGGEIRDRGGRGIIVLLEDALAWYESVAPGGSSFIGDGEWVFAAAEQIGDILERFVLEAHTRGAIPDVTTHFSSTTDSNGDPWLLTEGEMRFRYNLNLYEVVKLLAALGPDFAMMPNLQLRGWNARGIDRTATHVFEEGVNIREGSERDIHSSPARAVLLVQGRHDTAGRVYEEVEDAGLLAAIGRKEGFLEFGATPSRLTLQKAGTKAIRSLRQRADGPVTIGIIEGDPSAPGKALVDYDLGDTVVYDTDEHGPLELHIAGITITENEGDDEEVSLDLGGTPFAESSSTDANTGSGIPSGGGPCDPCGPGEEGGGNAVLQPISRTIGGPLGDGIGIEDGLPYATWDTGNSSIFHSDAQPKAGLRQPHTISSGCGPGDDATYGEHRMIAAVKYHFGGGGGHSGPQLLQMSYAASHGVGWPNLHPQIGPYVISYFVYPGSSTNDDAPGDSWRRGIIIGEIPLLGPSTNSVQISGTFETVVDLGIPFDDSWNVIFQMIPVADWSSGGFACDVSGTFSGYVEMPSSGGPNSLSDGDNPVGPGWYTGPIAAGDADGTNTIFVVPFGYDFVREVTVNGIEISPTNWLADDGSTIEFDGWAPLETDRVEVKRFIPE